MGYYSWRHGGGGEVRTITKVGNSFMVALPRHYLERLNLKKGDEVIIQRLGESEWEGLSVKPMKKVEGNGDN